MTKDALADLLLGRVFAGDGIDHRREVAKRLSHLCGDCSASKSCDRSDIGAAPDCQNECPELAMLRIAIPEPLEVEIQARPNEDRRSEERRVGKERRDPW